MFLALVLSWPGLSLGTRAKQMMDDGILKKGQKTGLLGLLGARPGPAQASWPKMWHQAPQVLVFVLVSVF